MVLSDSSTDPPTPSSDTSSPTMMRGAESRLDEGYSGGSEETRSLSGSDTNMQLDHDTEMNKMQALNEPMLNHLLSLPAEQRAALAAALFLGLPESDKSDTAYAVIRSLRISSIASIVDRLNPLLHKDPAMILPPEMTALVFLHLSPTDLLRASIASRSWRERALDSGLWRVFFTREGWSADMAEIRAAEARETHRRLTSSRHSTIKASRRKRDGDAEASGGSIKRAKEASGHMHRPEASTSNFEEWREQHGTPEADEDHVMHEDTSAEAHSATAPPSFDNQSSSGDSIPVDLSPPLSPAFFTSTAESPRVNWLWLYKQRRRLEDNWHKGRYVTFQLPHPNHQEEAHDECVYTIQHSRRWLVSGSRDKTIGVWDLDTQRRVRTLSGAHKASVLCLQFDEREGEDIVVSGGSDSYVVVWKFSTGQILRKMDQAHAESVLNLRFDHRYLITCSKDKTIKIWNRREVFSDDPIVPAVARRQLEVGGMNPIPEYSLLVTLEGHGAAVNAIQVHESQIVSASGDRTIKAWDINTGHCIRTYAGHTKGIACVQFDGRRIVSGSSDNTVRIFDAATSAEVACLQGHANLVRTVQARFGDMHDTAQDLEAAARVVDQKFHDARASGDAPDQRRRRGIRNAGSSDPNEVCSIGAKIPPGGGGNTWSRIVSGSYDETIIIWRKDADGKWVAGKRLHQDETLSARSRRSRNNVAPAQVATTQQLQQAHQRAAAARNGTTVPAVAHAFLGGQATTMNGAQAQVAMTSLAAMSSVPTQNDSTGHHQPPTGPAPAPAPAPATLPQPHTVQHGRDGHHRNRDTESNRVFKLQFDSRRIISCSQNRIIVGWDFAAGDPDLIEASRFFGETN